MRFIKHPAKAFRYTFIWDQFWNCWKQKPKNAKQPTTKIPSRKPNLLLFGWLAGQVTHLLWFFVFEVVDVEIKRAGDGQTQMGHRGDQSHPGGPVLKEPDSELNAMQYLPRQLRGRLQLENLCWFKESMRFGKYFHKINSINSCNNSLKYQRVS